MSELVLPKGGKVTRCSIVEYVVAVRGRYSRAAPFTHNHWFLSEVSCRLNSSECGVNHDARADAGPHGTAESYDQGTFLP